jgi:hypothetical protein
VSAVSVCVNKTVHQMNETKLDRTAILSNGINVFREMLDGDLVISSGDIGLQQLWHKKNTRVYKGLNYPAPRRSI